MRTNRQEREAANHVKLPVTAQDVILRIPASIPVQFEFSLCEQFPNELLTNMREQVVNNKDGTFSPFAGKVLRVTHGTIRAISRVQRSKQH